jgi:hypothetical protein
MDVRKRQIVQALKVTATELESQARSRDDTVDFDGQVYLILDASFAAELVYLLHKAAVWMEQEEGESGEETYT